MRRRQLTDYQKKDGSCVEKFRLRCFATRPPTDMAASVRLSEGRACGSLNTERQPSLLSFTACCRRSLAKATVAATRLTDATAIFLWPQLGACWLSPPPSDGRLRRRSEEGQFGLAGRRNLGLSI